MLCAILIVLGSKAHLQNRVDSISELSALTPPVFTHYVSAVRQQYHRQLALIYNHITNKISITNYHNIPPQNCCNILLFHYLVILSKSHTVGVLGF